jgi:crotonobetainyl-CoA:carnitine CoA-transferase CaiB-like acyl-CoA transferase
MAGSFLAGVRVLDLSIWRPGPYATSLLCALGADVLKVEPPGGDPMRHYAGLFEEINAGKRSVMLNLKTPPDRERAHALALQADVLVEGFRPGVMARLGLDEPGLRRANTGLVYCSISGYGQEGERALVPGHDVNYQAWSGALTPEGGRATIPPLPVADLAAGMSAAFGVCAALAGRATTGEGAHLDVSMTDVLSTWTGRFGPSTDDDSTPVAGASAAGKPTGGESSAVPGYGIFATADGGQVSLGVVDEQHFWSALCTELGRPDLATLQFSERTVKGKALQAEIAAAIATRSLGELVDALLAAGVPVAPVLDRATMLKAADFPNFPIRLGTAVQTGRVPRLDEHCGEGFRPRW